jgi:hypothetical protein
MAITSVESYALRRAAIGLGDRLGLGLYNDGKIEPLVKGTLQLTDPESPLYQEPKKEEGPLPSSATSPDAGRVSRLQSVVRTEGA